MYFSEFALLEEKINSTLSSLLGLRKITSPILMRNIDISDKIRILRTLVSHLIFDIKQRDIFQKALKSFQEQDLLERNMMAHSPFGRPIDGEGDGVVFLTIKAATRLKINSDDFWPIARFFDRVDNFEKIKVMLVEIQKSGTSEKVIALLDAIDNGEFDRR